MFSLALLPADEGIWYEGETHGLESVPHVVLHRQLGHHADAFPLVNTPIHAARTQSLANFGGGHGV